MKPVASDDQGWIALRPGWLLNGLFAGCLILVLLMAFALANITSRADWREQITPLVCMILGFGVGAIYIGRISYGRTVKWNGDSIVIAPRFGETKSYAWESVQAVTTNSFTGEHIIVFECGDKLRVPTMMKGVNQLARQLQSRGFR